MKTGLSISLPLVTRVASILAVLFGVALLAACSSSSTRTADKASTLSADQPPLPSTERHNTPKATSSEPTRQDFVKEHSEPEPSRWTFEMASDKVTDTPMLSASIKADSGDGKNDYGYPSHLLYELTFKCGAGVNQVTLFTSTTPTTDECSSHGRDCTTARLIPWVIERSSGTFVAPFRYRLDNANGDTASLVLILGIRRNAFDQRASGDASVIFRGTRTLPQSRLVVADVFPGETVEFSFSTLTQEQRTAIEMMCFR